MKKQILKNICKKSLSATLCAGVFTLLVSGQVFAANTHSYVPYVTPTVAVSATNYGELLTSPRWNNEVRTNLNRLIEEYGNKSLKYNKNIPPYAVFDFDNTTAILDVEEQLCIWQLEHLQFAMTPERFAEVIRTGIPKDKENLTYGADNGSGVPVMIGNVIDDVIKDYAILYKEGLINVHGTDLTASQKASPVYKDFVTKMRWLYDAIDDKMDSMISYPWLTYWYTGMTPQEVYNMAYSSDAYYSDPNRGRHWGYLSWTSPSESTYKTKGGTVSVKFKNGVTVSPEIKELYAAFKNNGIDTWIDTASAADVVRAAVDYFKIPGVKGIVGMTNKLDENGRYTNEYDYELHPQTQGKGKSETIEKVIAPLYNGQGPIFTAMDSQGDFNFCTEFKSTKAGLILNRIRKDDAGLCAAAAVYQAKHHIDLDEANKNGDTKYLLQGRNENIGELWSKADAMNLGKNQTGLLSEKSEKALADLENGMSLHDMFQKHTKLKDYKGYKSRD